MRSIFTDIQFRIEWLLLRTGFALAHLLPTDIVIRLSGFFWGTLAPLLKRHGRAEQHLANAIPELSPERRGQIIRGMWRNLGMTFAEAVELDRLALQPERVQFTPEARRIVETCREQPGVFASLHMGNWEAASWAAQICGVRFAGVYQQVRNPYVERLLLSNRLPFYPGGLYAKGADAVRKLIAALNSGISVCMMADLRELRGISVPFFGREAPSTPFPATLARSHGKPLYAARVLRRAPGRFEVEVVEIAVPHTADRNDDIRQATAALHRQFEAWIRADPEQWMWAHRRFER